MDSSARETKLTLLYIVIAFAFSVGMRLIWMYHFDGYDAFKWNGQFMINTNDGYYWAEGARDILSGVHQDNDGSPVNSLIASLTAFFASVLPFSFESIIFYMPAFLSSLIVIPIILIAKDLRNLEMGLIAALLASIAWSYYNRTMIGYYDTDMLNIVLPMFLLWSIIWAIDKGKDRYILASAITIVIYSAWYPQSYSLEVAFFGLVLLYTIIFDRKNTYNYKLLALMMIAMINIWASVKIILIIGALVSFRKDDLKKYIPHVLLVSIVAFFITGGFTPIWSMLKGYIFTSTISEQNNGLGLHFYSVIKTVMEAGHIPFETFANRISGHTIIFVLSVIGYLYLAFKHRMMLFALPLVGLGFVALVGGLRFTVYAVPVLAMGVAFLITEISSKSFSSNIKYKYTLMFVLTLAILYPNYKHINGYLVPTVLSKPEVKVLEKLKTDASRDDYAIAWWDYGFPIRYYADVKTIIDGAHHTGDQNFPVSYILTHPPQVSAKMAKLDVFYQEKRLNGEVNGSNIKQMTIDYGYKDTNKFLSALESGDIKLPKKTPGIYFYLPYKMLNIYPTISVFSNMDLMTGAEKRRPFLYTSTNFKEDKYSINLNRGIVLDKQTLTLTLGRDKIQPKRLIKTGYQKNTNGEMEFVKNIQNINPRGQLSIIYMSSYHMFLVVDEDTYNSLYVQLMILENYDKDMYELVASNPYAKVYKLKM